MPELTTPVSYGKYLVAFVDLLGQREQVMKLSAMPPTPEFRDSILNVLTTSAGRVKTVRENLKHVFNDFRDRAVEKSALTRPEWKTAHFAALTEGFNFYQLGFSDSFVLGIPLSVDDRFGFARSSFAVSTALHAIALVTLKAMGEWGIPLRGGIDVGYGIDLYPNEIYGPASLCAYNLESEVAGYPRVVVGQGLLDELTRLEASQGTDWNSIASRQIAAKCREVLCHDPIDGLPMLNPLSKSVLGMNRANPTAVPKAIQWAHAQLAVHEKVADGKVAEKYRRLLVYLEAETKP